MKRVVKIVKLAPELLVLVHHVIQGNIYKELAVNQRVIVGTQ